MRGGSTMSDDGMSASSGSSFTGNLRPGSRST
nr:MAG TPA: hypothetical protein [Caudoviricetes sp.]